MRAATIIAVVVAAGQAFQPPAATAAPSETVDVRYARAQLQLAEANLSCIELCNKRVAGSVPSSVVAEYQQHVQVAKTRLEQASAGRAAREFQVWLERAAAEQRAAETTWKNATAVNAQVPGTFDALDVKRFRLRADVAKLQLERGQTLADADRETQMEWEVEMLDNQVQRLKEESHSAPAFIHTYPVWRW